MGGVVAVVGSVAVFGVGGVFRLWGFMHFLGVDVDGLGEGGAGYHVWLFGKNYNVCSELLINSDGIELSYYRTVSFCSLLL